MSAVSDRWRAAAAAGGVRPVTEVTVTIPGGTPVPLTVDGCTVTKSLESGARNQASIAVVRQPQQATLDLVTTPGAIVAIDHGWNYGASQREVIPFGRYELASAPKSSRSQTIGLALMDGWKRLEEVRLLAPVTAALSTNRISYSTARITDAIPGQTFRTTATGGTVGTATTWERERTTLLNDLARDGGYRASFAPDGVFEFSPLPDLGAVAVAAFTDGDAATILELEAETPYTRLYNAVRVIPNDDQAWTAVTVQISDTDNPRHPSKIGLRPYFFSSPTIGSSGVAKVVGGHMLQRILATLSRVEVTTWAAGDLEPGDIFTTVQGATWTDDSLTGRYVAETIEHNLLTLETRITGSSAIDVPTEEG